MSVQYRDNLDSIFNELVQNMVSPENSTVVNSKSSMKLYSWCTDSKS